MKKKNIFAKKIIGLFDNADDSHDLFISECNNGNY